MDCDALRDDQWEQGVCARRDQGQTRSANQQPAFSGCVAMAGTVLRGRLRRFRALRLLRVDWLLLRRFRLDARDEFFVIDEAVEKVDPGFGRTARI